MEIRSPSDLRFVVDAMTAAKEVGEEADNIISSLLGLDDPAPSGAGGAFHKAALRRHAIKRATLGFHPRQVGRAKDALGEFAGALRDVPPSVDFLAVGRIQVVSDDTARLAAGWPERMQTIGNRRTDSQVISELRNEVASALADLTKAQMSAKLCAMRMKRPSAD